MARARHLQIAQLGHLSGSLSHATHGFRGGLVEAGSTLMGLTRRMYLSVYVRVLAIRDASPFSGSHVKPG